MLHRADLQRVFSDAAIKAGASVVFGKIATLLDVNQASLTLQDGSTAVGDLIVSADAIRSSVRHKVISAEDIELRLTDECLIRTMIPKSAVGSNQSLLDFSDQSSISVWADLEKRLVMYTVRQGNLLNVVWNDHGDGPIGSWNEPADLDELRKRFALFEPPVQQLLKLGGYASGGHNGDEPEIQPDGVQEVAGLSTV